MSDTTHDLTKPTGSCNALPTWIASGILGLALGAGGMYLGMQFYVNDTPEASPAAIKEAAERAGVPSGGPPGGGRGGMGGGGMGMGGMGGGMGGMGGGAGNAGKRNLTSLVGKLELLSRPELKLHVELDAEQAKKVAAKLEEINKAEKMTAEEAQANLDDLEALLTPEQKTTLGLVGLPFAGRGGGGAGGGGGAPMGAAGRPGAAAGAGAPPLPPGAPPGGAMSPMMGMGGMGGGAPDENPFTQEANQKRLKDLLGRLAPSTAAKESPAETPAAPETEKPAAAKEAG